MTKGKTLLEVFSGEKVPTVHPRRNHVALRRLPKRAVRRQSGIELPDDYRGMPHLGEVVEVGEGCGEFQAGDRVFFDMTMGREITLESGTLVFVHEDDLIARIEE